MGAFHVVGVNLQLRLGIDLRVIGKQQVAVGLFRVGFLRVFVNNDAAVKNAVRVTIENAVIELAAAAMRTGMLDEHVIVHVLAAVADEQPVDQTLAAFAGQHRMNVVTNKPPAQKHRMRTHIRAAGLLSAQGGDVKGLAVFALEQIVRNHSVFARDQFGYSVGKGNAAAERDIVFHDAGFSGAFGYDEISRIGHLRMLSRNGDEQEIDRRFQRRSARQVDVRSVFDECGIQCSEGVALDIQVAAQVRFERCAILRNRPCQASDPHALRQVSQLGQFGSESAVEEYELASRAGNAARVKSVAKDGA